MEAVNFPERLLNGDWNCTSGNCFYIAPHITAKITNFIVSTKCLKNLKLPHITAKITYSILSTGQKIASHYCKNGKFHIFHPLPRKPLLQKLPILYFPPIGQKTITAKITNFIFTAQCQEKHDCKNHQFYISCPDPRKNYQFYISRPVPRKSSNLSQLTVCLRVSGEKKRKEEANPNILKQSRSTNNSKNIEFMIKMWSLVFQLDLEMSYDKRQANA